jgi:hypothetical protein
MKHWKEPVNWLAELPNTVNSCNWFGVVTARLASEWAGSVISVLRTFAPLRVHSKLQSMWKFLKRTENA